MEWDANHSRVMKSLTNRITIASERLQIHLRDFHNNIQYSHKYTFQLYATNDTLVEFEDCDASSLSWSGVVGNRFPPGSKLDEGVIGGVKLEGVLLRVLYIVVEIA